MTHEYWRERQVRDATKLSRSTRWRLESQGKFPRRRQLSANAVGWLRSEVEAWVVSREPVCGRRS
ncbi:MAG: AlpA family phage regulatory protein [Candidatus Accumulibacter phosphatis]|jgi:prophage regulatory protein|uniref:AlpA family phage regulatory protein n=1 Tax=Candidatus Accumulibacter contiguus TaxID=2954381 RepID=A0ABX1TDX0_9PROT|nr:AlpA family phage regulatory protein [Candidatus Accumulibacter contiguus]NMQ07288.1 AlpA family phage regulatory protein [Candidatus Accumulibacter contiguus]